MVNLMRTLLFILHGVLIPGDILEAGEDVTERFIVDGPGHEAGSSPFSRFVAHPMVVMVVGSLVVAFVVWVLGWGK
jgi:hypothetical protein